MILKLSSNGPVSVQPVMSEPTKLIVRCCELRKLRMGQTPALNDSQRIRVKIQG